MFFIHPCEVKNLIYVFNYFKIMDTHHVDMQHVAKHLIVMWHVPISFIMMKWLAQITFQLLKIQSICQKNLFPMQISPTQAYGYNKIYKYLRYSNARWIVCCHVVFKDWLHAMYVSTFYMCLGEHNRKMSSKTYSK